MIYFSVFYIMEAIGMDWKPFECVPADVEGSVQISFFLLDTVTH